MIRLIAFAAFALVVASSAQAMPVAPVHESNGLITEVAYGCGPFRTRVHWSAPLEPDRLRLVI
jgi:hypothetical protein